MSRSRPRFRICLSFSTHRCGRENGGNLREACQAHQCKTSVALLALESKLQKLAATFYSIWGFETRIVTSCDPCLPLMTHSSKLRCLVPLWRWHPGQQWTRSTSFGDLSKHKTKPLKTPSSVLSAMHVEKKVGPGAWWIVPFLSISHSSYSITWYHLGKSMQKQCFLNATF